VLATYSLVIATPGNSVYMLMHGFRHTAVSRFPCLIRRASPDPSTADGLVNPTSLLRDPRELYGSTGAPPRGDSVKRTFGGYAECDASARERPARFDRHLGTAEFEFSWQQHRR